MLKPETKGDVIMEAGDECLYEATNSIIQRGVFKFAWSELIRIPVLKYSTVGNANATNRRLSCPIFIRTESGMFRFTGSVPPSKLGGARDDYRNVYGYTYKERCVELQTFWAKEKGLILDMIKVETKGYEENIETKTTWRRHLTQQTEDLFCALFDIDRKLPFEIALAEMERIKKGTSYFLKLK